jgi:hypothetical protein
MPVFGVANLGLQFRPVNLVTDFTHYRLTKHGQGKQSNQYRRDGRVVEGARLESVYTATYRGFEPLSLRHLSI